MSYCFFYLFDRTETNTRRGVTTEKKNVSTQETLETATPALNVKAPTISYPHGYQNDAPSQNMSPNGDSSEGTPKRDNRGGTSQMLPPEDKKYEAAQGNIPHMDDHHKATSQIHSPKEENSYYGATLEIPAPKQHNNTASSQFKCTIFSVFVTVVAGIQFTL